METYNGWTNYETWCVNLWISNDYGMYQEVTDWTGSASDATELADWIRDMIEENAPNLTGPYSDLLNHSISRVNWLEIAKGFLEE